MVHFYGNSSERRRPKGHEDIMYQHDNYIYIYIYIYIYMRKCSSKFSLCLNDFKFGLQNKFPRQHGEGKSHTHCQRAARYVFWLCEFKA